MDTPTVETFRAGCKINLYLDILGRREDGYHELETLFYPLDIPADTLTFTRRASLRGENGKTLTLTCSREELASESNLVSKAYYCFAKQTGFAPEVAIHLDKQIPSGAGLGGGSSDAACVLNWMNANAGDQALPVEELHALATTLGADVPFFLENKPAWATSIGEKLEFVDLDLSDFWVVLVYPDISVSTPWAYKGWDDHWEAFPSTPKALKNKDFLTNLNFFKKNRKSLLTRTGSIYSFPSCSGRNETHNGFEVIVFKQHNRLRYLKEEFLRRGATAALMSGSGSSLFGLFREQKKALETFEALCDRYVSTYIQRA